MTYGWALLVIVVVGAALFALGVLNPSTYTQSGCRGFQYFVYQDQQLTNSAHTYDLLNGPKDIVLDKITIGGVQSSAMSPSTTVSGGSRFLLTGANNVAAAKNVGDPFSYTVVIRYNVTNGIQGSVDTATCTGKVQ